MTVCAEISYDGVHSDICPPEHEFSRVDDEYRDFMHKCLDEWFDRSKGKGIFYIKDSSPDCEYQFTEVT